MALDSRIKPIGRFAPTPSGRMHLGNVFAAFMAWLAVRSLDGELVLRMEDLDPERTSVENADILRDDLHWLGLDWDWEMTPQSHRSSVYDRYFAELKEKNLLYPCYCTRSQLHSVNAPHLSDGTYVYPGTCRNLTDAQRRVMNRAPAWRVIVPNQTYSFDDQIQGHYVANLQPDCGDIVVRRADGIYVYQLAVTVDDGEAGINQVVRGADLLSSVPRQMYLQDLFGFSHPEYAHIPLLTAPDGRRLSKRDADLDMGTLRQHATPAQILGLLAYSSGLISTRCAVSAKELVSCFALDRIRKESIQLDACFFQLIDV